MSIFQFATVQSRFCVALPYSFVQSHVLPSLLVDNNDLSRITRAGSFEQAPV